MVAIIAVTSLAGSAKLSVGEMKKTAKYPI
jgi:hypothetical protein